MHIGMLADSELSSNCIYSFRENDAAATTPFSWGDGVTN